MNATATKRISTRAVLVSSCILLGASLLPAFGDVWYVDVDNAAGPWDGTSWPTAFQTIQEGINAAYASLGGEGEAEVWVAEGLYDEPRTSDPHGSGNTGSVMMKEDVHLCGGFADTETERDQRDWEIHLTVIDGATARDGDPACHVIVGADNATLDGFTITGGNANGGDSSDDPERQGGGMYNSDESSPTVTNCTFSGNSASGYHGSGGGMYNSNSSPTVTNCTFTGNSAEYRGDGAGMYNYNYSSPTVTNCTFTGNSAYDGGGMFNSSSSPTVTNCTFTGNLAHDSGGGMFNYESSPTVANCTFTDNCANWAHLGGGMYNCYSSPTVTNCILWGDSPREVYNLGSSYTVVAYSDIEGGYEGEGNLDADPLFVSGDAGVLRLRAGSPCIDSGTATGAPPTDLRGVARPQGAGLDMGAYEYDGTPAACIDADRTFDCVPLMVEFTDESYAGDGPLLSWLWDFGDGGTSGTPNPTHTFVEPGVYTVTLTVTSALGTDTVTLDIRALPAAPWYADAGNTAGPWDGASWATAFQTIQEAIEAAAAAGGGQVWVAAGTYTSSSDPVVSMKPYVQVYAGFPGGETARDQRDWDAHQTTIDGEDTRRCVTGANAATLDGFIVTQGYACAGGGMYNRHSSPTVTNCTFTANSAYGRGGGMCNENYSSPTVTNCTFTANSADSSGGGMCNYSYSSPTVTVTNCTFTDNSADHGGGMYNRHSSPTVTNCTFSNNTAEYGGGGMYTSYSSPTVTNCILWGDSPDEVCNYGSSDPVVAYSDIEGGCAGTGNIDADPLFIAGPSGTSTDLSYDAATWKSTLRDSAANFSPDALVGLVLSVGDSESEHCYVITDNDETTITVWGDATEDGTVTSPVPYVVMDYHVSEDSPCIDAGDPDPACNDPEDPARPGYALYPALGTVRNDMGAYGGPGAGDLGGEGEGEGESHSADTNDDWQVSATEIGRVVGFYNAGGYYVHAGTLDGYAPGAGSHDGAPHDSDYAPEDWQISAVELGRLVTFYNAGGYIRDPGTQDGFAPILPDG